MTIRLTYVLTLAVVQLLLGTGIARAEVRFVEATPVFNSVQDRAHLLITGQITSEDVLSVDRLLPSAVMQTHFRTWGGTYKPLVLVNSPGGDLMAAMKIGQALRKVRAWVWVDKAAECASACVFILAGGVERNIVPGARVRIHRPYFEKTSFADLSLQDAQTLYGKQAQFAKSYLRDMGMSDALFERMLRVPSQKAVLLNTAELETLGLQGEDPAYQEWNRANQEKSLGEERFRQVQGLTDCVNSGTEQSICEKKWGLKFSFGK